MSRECSLDKAEEKKRKIHRVSATELETCIDSQCGKVAYSNLFVYGITTDNRTF